MCISVSTVDHRSRCTHITHPGNPQLCASPLSPHHLRHAQLVAEAEGGSVVGAGGETVVGAGGEMVAGAGRETVAGAGGETVAGAGREMVAGAGRDGGWSWGGWSWGRDGGWI